MHIQPCLRTASCSSSAQCRFDNAGCCQALQSPASMQPLRIAAQSSRLGSGRVAQYITSATMIKQTTPKIPSTCAQEQWWSIVDWQRELNPMNTLPHALFDCDCCGTADVVARLTNCAFSLAVLLMAFRFLLSSLFSSFGFPVANQRPFGSKTQCEVARHWNVNEHEWPHHWPSADMLV